MRPMAIVLALIGALVVLAPAANAEDKISIGVLKFLSEGRGGDRVSTAVEQMVYSRFADRRQFRVVERSRMDAIQAELAAQDILEVADKTALQSAGADYVVMGQVTQADVSSNHTQQGGTYYTAIVSYGVRIIDVSTGEVAHSESFSNGRGNMFANAFAGFGGDRSSPAGAVDIAVQQTGKQFDAFLNSAFPSYGRMLSVETRDRKGAPLTVLVSLGKADGVGKKSKALAFRQESLLVDGRELVRKRPVAELSFVRSEGDQLSVFRIKNPSQGVEEAVGSDSVFVEIAP